MNAKDHFTLYVATNSTGSQQVPLMMIGSSKNPRCFGQNLEKVKFKYLIKKRHGLIHRHTQDGFSKHSFHMSAQRQMTRCH